VDAVDHILEGLEAALALERELGVRTVEFSRDLLAPPASAGRVSAARPAMAPASVPKPTPAADVKKPAAPEAPATVAQPSSEPVERPRDPNAAFDFVFLHDRPLSPRGREMMDKIVAALGRTDETAPVVFDKPIPRAKIYVVLGALALRKFQPTLRGAPGMWLTTARGSSLLVTYSPEYILRFREVTPAVDKIKRDMWQSLKEVVRRIAEQS